jgi:hypothetical protein
MGHAETHRREYKMMKENLLSDIWHYIKNRDDKALNINYDLTKMETKRIPAIVTNVIDDQESETIDKLIVKNDKVIVVASNYDEIQEYNLEEFEVPFLIAILDSVEKHLELEEKM